MPPASAPARSGELRRELVPLYPGWHRLPDVVAFSGYFDESKSRERGIMAIAGYVAPVELWDQSFSPAWLDVLANAPHSVSEFKAADCSSGQGEFNEPWTLQERIDFTSSLVSTIVEPTRPVLGVGAAVVVNYGMAISKKQRKQLERAAYLWAFTLVIRDVLKGVENFLGTDRLHIIFDEEKHMKERARKMFEVALDLFAKEWRGKVRDPDFAPSHEVPPIQAADLLAFETYKAMENRLANFPRPPRKSLERLLEGGIHVAQYCELEGFLKKDPKWMGTPGGSVQYPTLYDSRPLHMEKFKQK